MSTAVVLALVIASIVAIILLTSRWKLNAFISLFIVSLVLAVAVLPAKNVFQIMKEGFGSTMGATGFLIIFGTVIAIILDTTGAATVLARYIISKTGEKHAVAAIGITGFIAGMSIFCDSGFIILSGLARSFSAKTKTSMALIAGVLGCSLLSVHCLIPTHPGALAAAGILNANIGHLVLLGTLFAFPGAIVAYWWVNKLTRNKYYPPSQEHDLKEHDETEITYPPVLLSFLPVVMPLLLIAVGSLLQILQPNPGNLLANIFIFTGQPVMALLIGVFFALLLFRKRNMTIINSVIEDAIEKAGPILIVIAAGGMFGGVIKGTGIGTIAGDALGSMQLGPLVPFLITVLLKTAQGSSTVAIITAASIVSPMLLSLGLGTETGKLFTLLAMGAGSMVISHANDAYFWVITKFSGLHADVTLRVYSTATAIMGITIFIFVWIAGRVFI